MTRRFPFLRDTLNLAFFGALCPRPDRPGRPRDGRPEKLRYQPRRFRRQPDSMRR